MAKGAMAIWNKIRKDEHRKSPLGKMEKELNDFYGARANRQWFENDEGGPNEHAKWIDHHRIVTRSNQNTLEIEFEKEYDALVNSYKEKTNELLLKAMQEELDYITKLQHA